MGAPTISPAARNTFQPLSFIRTRNGDVFMYDGLSRGLRWDGITSTAELAGITAPSGAPTFTGASGGAATAGVYVGGVQFIDDTLPDAIQSDLSALATVTLTDNQKVSWSNIPVSSESRVTQKRLWLSTSEEAETLYLVATIANATTSYSGYTSNDDTLATQTFLPILQPNGDLNARRFAPPPNDKPFAAVFQDRVFMAGRVAYNVGTVTTNGTTAVTGSGTSWTTQMAGRYIYIDGEPAPLVVSSVGSATSITLTTAATTTASGKSYTLIPSPALRNTLFYAEDDEPESFGGQVVNAQGITEYTNEATIQDNTGDEDEITGLMPYGSFLYVLKERHIYSLKFIRQPKIDIGINCIAWRGCLSNRCWDILDGVAYLVDATGIYRFAGGAPQPIDSAIQNLFYNGTIDFTNAKWFWVKADTQRKLVYFAVNYTADNSTRPMRALVYNVPNDSWEPERWIWEVGGAAVCPIGGAARFLVGTEHDLILVAGQGTSDIVAAVRGTATAGGNTTLTDSTASFTASMVDAPLAIVAGTGAGQIRRISAQTSTQLTVSAAWTTNPSTDSVYVVGAIQWNFKSGQWEFPPSEKRYTRSLKLSIWPTTHANYVTLKQFKNKYQTAVNQRANEDRGVGVVATAASPSIVFDVSQARSPLDDASSVQRVDIPGIVDDRSNAQRWIAIEASGFQGQDQISVDRIELIGAHQ